MEGDINLPPEVFSGLVGGIILDDMEASHSEFPVMVEEAWQPKHLITHHRDEERGLCGTFFR